MPNKVGSCNVIMPYAITALHPLPCPSFHEGHQKPGVIGLLWCPI